MTLSKNQPLRIEICGGIASGKTTLAHLLAEASDYQLALEKFRENPFWERFYAQPNVFVQEKNLCFLPQHSGEIKAMNGTQKIICDYAVFQDLAYATLCNDERHLDTMRRLYADLYTRLPAPTVIVQLICSAEVQLQRIHARARREEKSISLNYLDSLNTAIDVMLQQTLPSGTRIHQLHSDQVDFVSDPAARATLRETILAIANEPHAP